MSRIATKCSNVVLGLTIAKRVLGRPACELGVTNVTYVRIDGPFTELEGLRHLESVGELQIHAPLTTLQGLRNLTTAGAQFGRDDLIESILFPSKIIREGNQQMEIETTDDESFVGLSKGETATEYRLLNANGQLISVPKAKVKLARLSNTSMMPEGLHRAMTPSEFADLIAYLETLK